MKKQYKLGVIGAGFMAQAILKGAIYSDSIKPKKIIVSDASEQALEKLEYLGVNRTRSNADVADNCEYLLIAVKPQNFAAVAESIRGVPVEKVITIMAGVRKDSVRSALLGTAVKVARAMPNLPCSIGSGMVALDAEEELDQLARAYAQLIVNKDAPDDPTLPDEFREDLHRTTIERITVHGAEVPFALGETSFGDATNPYQRSYISHGRGIVARWSEAQGCYLVRVDMGGADPQVRDESGSWLVQQVAGLAGGTYEDGAGYFAWSVNDMDGRMEFLGFEDGRNAAQLELNGQTNRISCDASDASNGDAVEMPVDDFAALFGLTARVDEAAGVIELV